MNAADLHPVAELAPAKINLFLHVTGRRADGYHELDSLIAFADIGDRISALPAPHLSLEISGPFAAGLAGDDDNLVLRAARLLADEAGVSAGAAITLEKNLPVAAGIGGGSADAAATLRALDVLWGIGMDTASLSRIGFALGADVPVCLFGGTARVTGIGELIAPAPDLPALGVLLVNPGIAVSTPAIFKARQGPFSIPVTWPENITDNAALIEALDATGNDLTAPALATAPEIGAVLEAVGDSKECLLARLSGSGATCFGLFNDAAGATAAARALVAHQPSWWVAATRFRVTR